jgi:hypothetical protein
MWWRIFFLHSKIWGKIWHLNKALLAAGGEARKKRRDDAAERETGDVRCLLTDSLARDASLSVDWKEGTREEKLLRPGSIFRLLASRSGYGKKKRAASVSVSALQCAGLGRLLLTCWWGEGRRRSGERPLRSAPGESFCAPSARAPFLFRWKAAQGIRDFGEIRALAPSRLIGDTGSRTHAFVGV